MPKIWIFFFFLMVGLGVGAFLTLQSSPAAPASESASVLTREDRAQEMLKDAKNTVLLSDQPAGEQEVRLGYVVSEQPGFVVVRSEEGGVPGGILGASALVQAQQTDVAVRLSEELKPDHVYFAQLVTDNGDGVFSEQTDKAVQNEVSGAVLMSFLAVP